MEPLNRTDITQLSGALFRLRENERDIEALASAGVDVTEPRQLNAFCIQRISALLDVYGNKKG